MFDSRSDGEAAVAAAAAALRKGKPNVSRSKGSLDRGDCGAQEEAEEAEEGEAEVEAEEAEEHEEEEDEEEEEVGEEADGEKEEEVSAGMSKKRVQSRDRTSTGELKPS